MFNIEQFNEIIHHLESIDESVKIKHLPRREWTDEMVKNKILLWQIPRSTAELLYSFVRLRKPRLVLEFGTSGGYSGLWISRALEENCEDDSSLCDAVLHTIEFSEYRARLAREHFEKSGLSERIVLHRGKIHSFIQDWSFGEIDFLFIDADKPHYREHLEMVEGFLSRGAVVLADNILDNPDKVKDFVDYMNSNPSFSTTIFEMDNGLLFAIKK